MQVVLLQLFQVKMDLRLDDSVNREYQDVVLKYPARVYIKSERSPCLKKLKLEIYEVSVFAVVHQWFSLHHVAKITIEGKSVEGDCTHLDFHCSAIAVTTLQTVPGI